MEKHQDARAVEVLGEFHIEIPNYPHQFVWKYICPGCSTEDSAWQSAASRLKEGGE